MKPAPSNLLLLFMLLLGYQSFGQWTKRTIGTNDLNCVRFLNSTTIFVGGTNGLYKSTNSGISFSSVSVPAFTSIRDIWIIDPLTIVAVGSSLSTGESIIKSINGGTSWTLVYSNNVGSLPLELNSVHFPTLLTGYATGTNNRILKTIDGGNNWTGLIAPSTQELRGVRFVTDFVGFVIGDTSIWKTFDGGMSWTPTHIGKKLRDITFTNNLTGFAVGDNIILKTIDQGITWTPKPATDNDY